MSLLTVGSVAKPPWRPPAFHATRVDVDRELVRSLRLGEASAAEHLISMYGSRAYRLAIRICGNAADAEEVVQDAVWAVISRIGTFRGEAAFSSWLYRIVANAAYQKLRTRRREPAGLSLDEGPPRLDEHGRQVAPVEDRSARLADESDDHAELRMTLISALEALPPASRTALLLHDVEGLSNREIADALDMSVSNVKVRVHRARLLLRFRLGGGLPGRRVDGGRGAGRWGARRDRAPA
jgi:RNA polymerase sigma-70 factor (ECF subfamily)